MRFRPPRRIMLPLLAMSAVVFATPSSAEALSCGSTLTHSIKLHSNLDCSAGGTDGIDVGKNGITINLNGHSVIGAGSIDHQDGIYNDGHDRVSVIGGTVKNFSEDIYLYGGAKPTVSRVRLTDNQSQDAYGVDAEYTNGGTFEHVRGNNLYTGIYVEEGGPSKVRESKITNSFYGVYVEEEIDTRVSDVSIRQSKGNGYGFYDDESTKTLFTHDTVKGGDFYYGFFLEYPFGTRIDRSTANGANYAGIYIEDNARGDGYHATVTNSTANHNDDYGMYSSYPGTTSSGNKAFGNPYGCYQVRCNG